MNSSAQDALEKFMDSLHVMSEAERVIAFGMISDAYCLHCGSEQPKVLGVRV